MLEMSKRYVAMIMKINITLDVEYLESKLSIIFYSVVIIRLRRSQASVTVQNQIATRIIYIRYFILYHLHNINQSGENIVFHRSIIFTIRWHLTLYSLHTSKTKPLLFHLILLILECMLVNITVIHQFLISIFSIIA